jgi:hypothetical protein
VRVDGWGFVSGSLEGHASGGKKRDRRGQHKTRRVSKKDAGMDGGKGGDGTGTNTNILSVFMESSPLTIEMRSWLYFDLNAVLSR